MSVICPICHKEMSYINNSHLKKAHGLSPAEFKERFPGVNTISDSSRKGMAERTDEWIVKQKDSHQKRSEKNKELYHDKNKQCKNCEKPLPYNLRRNNFCDRSCAATFTNKVREVVYSEKAKEKLRSVGLLLNQKYKNIRQPTKIVKECPICNKNFITTYKNKSKKNCSKICRKKYNALYNFRQTKTIAKSGYYQGVYCASTWELAFLITNLDAGKIVKRCEFNFKYTIDDKEKLYFPDFIMDDIIYEVKGWVREDVKIKMQAVIDAGRKVQLIKKKKYCQ